MDFRSIIGFIAIMVISSLFNKDKKAVKPTIQPSKTTPSGRPAAKVPNSNKNRRTTFTGGLEDLFGELKGEFYKTFEDNGKKQSYSDSQQNTVNIDNVKTNQDVQKDSYNSFKDSSKLDRDSVYEREIGKEEIPIEFNRKSIIQGVIMSEILQKPKSLRR